MKIKKLYSYKSPGQIWRILISDTDKLILETRDTNTKEIFFQCFTVEGGIKIFSDLQLEEKYWLGIEVIYKDIIFFHKFPKPDLPGHKEIIALDINKKKVLWVNSDLAFLFVYQDRIYGFKQGFEERFFYSLDFKSGKIIEEFGDDYGYINTLRKQSENEKDWSAYLFPREHIRNDAEDRINNIIENKTKTIEIVGKVEYNIYKDLILFNFHSKDSSGSIVNNFKVVDLNSGKEVLSEVLNNKVTALFTDSFFLYKKFLILLREKNEIIVYRIE